MLPKSAMLIKYLSCLRSMAFPRRRTVHQFRAGRRLFKPSAIAPAIIEWPCRAARRTLEPMHATKGLLPERSMIMARKAKKKRKYAKSAGSDGKNEIRRYKKGTAKSGRGGKAGKVKSPNHALPIRLSHSPN